MVLMIILSAIIAMVIVLFELNWIVEYLIDLRPKTLDRRVTIDTINILIVFIIHSEVGCQLLGSPKWSIWPHFEVLLWLFSAAIPVCSCKYSQILNFWYKKFCSRVNCWLSKPYFYFVNIENIEFETTLFESILMFKQHLK